MYFLTNLSAAPCVNFVFLWHFLKCNKVIFFFLFTRLIRCLVVLLLQLTIIVKTKQRILIFVVVAHLLRTHIIQFILAVTSSVGDWSKQCTNGTSLKYKFIARIMCQFWIHNFHNIFLVKFTIRSCFECQEAQRCATYIINIKNFAKWLSHQQFIFFSLPNFTNSPKKKNVGNALRDAVNTIRWK